MALDEGSDKVYVVKISGDDLRRLDQFVRGRGTNRLEVVAYALSVLYSNFADIMAKGKVD